MKSLLLLCICFASAPLWAQTAQQKSVVRKITHSRQDPSVPVAGVRVVVGGVTSPKSNSGGKLSFAVPVNRDKSFVLQDVRIPAGSGYILATPNKRNKIYLSPNELQIALITPEEKEQVTKATYNSLFRKYRKQGNLLMQKRNELEELQLELDESDAKYQQLTVQIDSLQKQLDQYFDAKNKATVTSTLQQVAQELAVTDYQSLDSIDARIYDLKKSGDWATLSRMLNDVMNGNAAAYLQEGVENREAAKAVLEAANADLSRRFQRMEEAIHAFKMQYKNDSVSKYYAILVKADPDNLEYLQNAGYFECSSAGNYQLAQTYFNRKLQLDKTDLDKANTLYWLGKSYLQQMNFEKALGYTLEACELQKKIFGKDSPHVAKTYVSLGSIYSYTNQDEKAQKYLESALKISNKWEDKYIMEKVESHYTLAAIYFKKGMYEELKLHTELSIDLLTRHFSKDHPALPNLYNTLGMYYRNKKNYAEAEKYIRMTIDSWTKQLGKEHPMLSYPFENLGMMYMEKGDFTQAEEYLQKSLDIRLKKYGPKNMLTIESYNNFGQLYLQMKQPEKALAHYEKALELALALYGEAHPEVAAIYENIGYIQNELGQADQALVSYQKALDIYKRQNKKKYDTAVEELQKEIDRLKTTADAGR